jgi:hypothetical protein
MTCQQHLVNALKELIDVNEKLLGPAYKPENVLPPQLTLVQKEENQTQKDWQLR